MTKWNYSAPFVERDRFRDLLVPKVSLLTRSTARSSAFEGEVMRRGSG